MISYLTMSTVLTLSGLSITYLPVLLLAYQEFVRDNTLSVNHVLYGDITKMDDMFINPSDYDEPRNEDVDQNVYRRQNINPFAASDAELQSIKLELMSNPLNVTRFDIDDYNKITQSLNNITTRRYYYDDPEDWWTYKEPYKKEQLILVGMQFLIHSRYKLVGAFRQREPLISNKAYRFGYLFNKLRRIQYEMSKLRDQLMKQHYYWSSETIYKYYEQFVRYHVDAKDLIEFIKMIDAEPDEESAEATTVSLNEEGENT